MFILFAFWASMCYSQTKLTPEQTLNLLNETNDKYCQVVKDLIDCMFTFDQAKFENTLSNLKVVRNNYDNIEKNGTLTGSGVQISMARSRFRVNQFGALAIFVDRKAYQNDKRNKTVKYHSQKRKIPKALAKQFKDLSEREGKICSY